jgi:predicted O-methyltransferase YrrM
MKEILLTLVAYIKNTLSMWNEPKRYKQLYSIIGQIHAENIMEIGTWRGTRSRLMILEALKHRPKENIAYYGFDLFGDQSSVNDEYEPSKQPPQMEVVKEELSSTGVRVSLFKGDTNEVLPRVIDSLPNMDFIFIDGGHSLTTVKNDWDYASRLMHDKTVVVFDDYWSNKTDGGAKPIVDAIDRTQYEVTILPRFDVFINPEHGRLVIKFARVEKLSNEKSI